MTDIKAHYDGKVFVPHEPVELKQGDEVTLRIEPRTSTTDAPDHAGARSWLDWALENPIESDDLPADLSTNLDHYLYGTPKDDDDR